MKVLISSSIGFILALTVSLSFGQNISFNQASLNFKDFDPINSGTSLKFGPDERLYVAQLNGQIKIYTVFRDSPNEYSVIGEEILSSIQSIPNHDDNGLLAFDNRGNRQITGASCFLCIAYQAATIS